MSRTLIVPALLTLALAAPVAPATAEPAAQPGPVAPRAVAPSAGAGAGGGTVTVEGHGFGHGKGLSQYGAQRAASLGRSHRQILGYYYPRTRIGKARGKIRVLLSGDTRNDLVVRDRSGLTVRSLGTGRTWRLTHRKARRWRITPAAGGARSRIAWQGRGRRWHTVGTPRGEAQFAARGRPIRLLGPAGPVAYRGALRSARNERGRVTVNVLPLEQYLRGVVPLEVPALWKPAAVRAQAVAARTYAAFERRSSRAAYDLCDTAHCQVYGGVPAEHRASDAAVRRTRTQVVARRGRPVFAQFNASSGGWTVDGGRPYLVARQDRFDAWAGNPYHDWTQSFSAAEVEQQWPAIGTLQGITVLSRDGNGEWGGRVRQLRLEGSGGTVQVSGDDFRVRLGLRSTWFQVAVS